MRIIQKILGLSIAAIVMAGCGDTGKLSERKVDSGLDSRLDSEEPHNYVIKAKEQRLTATQKEIVRVHNERRRLDFSDSDLGYSLELEEAAQAYANKLAESGKREHDPKNAEKGYGENIFAHSTNKNIQIEDAMRVWYDNEKEIYDYETGECNTSKVRLKNDAQATCGHYTQVAWQNTKEVGCASALYKDRNDSNLGGSVYDGGSVYVCKYRVPGNVINEKPYCTNYTTSDIYTGITPTINTLDISGKNLEIELVEEDRVNCTRKDNRNGAIYFSKSFKSAQLRDFDIFNGDSYTVTLDFDNVTIVDNMVKLKGIGIAPEKYPIFMNIKFVGEANDYYGVELEWNGHNENNATLSRKMKAKIYK